MGALVRGFWITFTDGSSGYCQGNDAYDAVQIAEKLTGKTVVVGANKWKPELKSLPYPGNPIIWQFDHPVSGKCPPFCFSPKECAGRTSCPKNYACSE
jgi:hypothetical protein